MLHHNQGIVFYYENNSKIYKLSEELIFKLSGCSIEGSETSNVAFVIKPGETYLINIVKDHGVDGFNVYIENLFYQVEPLVC